MDWTDERWTGLEGGYRVPFDPRPLLLRLRSTPYSDPLWSELIGELYHQGDVGEASYAAVPELSRLIPENSMQPWQLGFLVEWIELARTKGTNPPIPDWIKADYFTAIDRIARRSLQELSEATTEEQTRGLLSFIAMWKGLNIYAEAVGNYTQDELKEILPY